MLQILPSDVVQTVELQEYHGAFWMNLHVLCLSPLQIFSPLSQLWFHLIPVHPTLQPKDTTIALTHFGEIFQDIQMNRFHYKLPVSVKKLSPIQKDPKPLKKLRETKRHINRAPEKDWKLRQNEQWESVFRHKSIDGPLLSMGCRPCLKYQCKGSCFDDCTNKDSHVNLINDDKTKTEKFIKQLRGE